MTNQVIAQVNKPATDEVFQERLSFMEYALHVEINKLLVEGEMAAVKEYIDGGLTLDQLNKIKEVLKKYKL